MNHLIYIQIHHSKFRIRHFTQKALAERWDELIGTLMVDLPYINTVKSNFILERVSTFSRSQIRFYKPNAVSECLISSLLVRYSAETKMCLFMKRVSVC